jgi:hypothetical protein
MQRKGNDVMRCDQVKEHIIHFVYGEINDQPDGSEIQEHLRTCPTCRGEVEELEKARKYLQLWKDEPPPQTLAIVRREKTAQTSSTWRYARYAAIAAMAVICILALANTHIAWNKEEFSLRTSLFPAPFAEQDYYTKAELRTLIKQALDDSELRMYEANFLMIQEALNTVEQYQWMDLRLNRSRGAQNQSN